MTTAATDEELERAVYEDPDTWDATALEDDVAPPEEEDGTEAVGFTSHVLSCGVTTTSYSTFRAPYTGQLWMRVAYYDAYGVRVWLSSWIYKGSVNALVTKTHVERWNFSRRIARAVVVARYPTWNDAYGTGRWASC